MKKMLLCLLSVIIFLFGFGFEDTDEIKIMTTINQMVDSINNKDANGYIRVLNDHFIHITYGDEDYIKKNIHKFGSITNLYVYKTTVKSYFAITHYYLTYEDPTGWSSDFRGFIILDKIGDEWKVHDVIEEEVKY